MRARKSLCCGLPGLLGLLLCVAACGDDDGSEANSETEGAAGRGARAGATAAGSGGSEAAPANCPKFDACGGEPEGVWQVRGVCLNNGKELFASTIGAACGDAYRSSSVEGEGSYELTEGQAKANFSLDTSVTLAFDDACIQSILGTAATAAGQCKNLGTALARDPNFASVACEVDDVLCVCDLTAPTMMDSQNGAYRVVDDELIINDAPVPFCVEGETMTVQPTVDGAVVTITLGK